MAFNEMASFVLKHSDINTTYNTTSAQSNSIGSFTAGKQSVSWRVDLKKVLGDTTFNRYNKFVLRLTQVGFLMADWVASGTDITQLIVRISGLNFLNSTYNVATQSNTNKCDLLLLTIPQLTIVVNNYTPNIGLCTFMKTSADVNITIEFIKVIDNTAVQYTGSVGLPHGSFHFDVIPIPT